MKSKGWKDGKHIDLSVGINPQYDFDDYLYNLAHELAHSYLHYDKGDIIAANRSLEYEEQADRAAKMILDLLSQE